MPYKINRGCCYPGCNKKADGGSYCAEHRKLLTNEYESKRAPVQKERYGKKWRVIRKRYVAAHPLCEMCLKVGKCVPVDEVHHIVPLSRGGTNDESNLMSLCRSCHNKIHIDNGDRTAYNRGREY